MDYYNRNYGYMPNAYNVPQARTNFEWLFVQDVNEVERVNVQPNNKVWIMVQNEPIFALRSADNMGLITTELYRFEKLTQKSKTEYITADELQEALNKLREELRNE